ncbi:hypothetical protein [Cereibacter azotoformans]|nr:hypothetical protein [Cereibacter azotoformans]MBO4168519.1 hypothetical protein [Cereibacter azotoformans]
MFDTLWMVRLWARMALAEAGNEAQAALPADPGARARQAPARMKRA